MAHRWRYPILSIIKIPIELLDVFLLWVSRISCLAHNAIFLQCHIKEEEELHRGGNEREQHRGIGNSSLAYWSSNRNFGNITCERGQLCCGNVWLRHTNKQETLTGSETKIDTVKRFIFRWRIVRERQVDQQENNHWYCQQMLAGHWWFAYHPELRPFVEQRAASSDSHALCRKSADPTLRWLCYKRWRCVSSETTEVLRTCVTKWFSCS